MSGWRIAGSTEEHCCQSGTAPSSMATSVLRRETSIGRTKILGWVPILKRDFPSWENYGDWYWERADLAGLSDDRYDSDGNTLPMSEDHSDDGCDKDDASDQSIQRIVNGFVGVDEMPSDDEDFGLGNDHGP